jgi:hypothetical protein
VRQLAEGKTELAYGGGEVALADTTVIGVGYPPPSRVRLICGHIAS